jgi:hypothetical protein
MNYLDAKDEIFGIANAAWTVALETLLLDYEPQCYFQGIQNATPNAEQIYAELSYVVVKEQQSSLANVNGTKLYESIGLFAMQVYAPKTDVSAFRQAETIASAVRDAFRQPSPSGEIWFTNQRATPVTGNAVRNQINVVVNCTYQTAK